MLDVLKPETNLLWPDQLQVGRMRVLVSAQDLAFVVEAERCPVGDARSNGEEKTLFSRVFGDFRGHIRPWTDEAHFTAKHVHQLREFIQPELPHEPA